MLNDTSSPARPDRTAQTKAGPAGLAPDPFACARLPGVNGERPRDAQASRSSHAARVAGREPKDVHCPRCRLGLSRRSVRTTAFERLVSLVYWYPFTCQLCSHRFLAFQPGVRYTRRGVDRREFDRYPVAFPIRLRSAEGAGTGTMKVLALNGCEVETEFTAQPGTLVELSVKMCQDLPDLVVEAAVVRSSRAAALGMEFLKLDPWQRARLNWCIAGLALDRQPER